MNVQNTAGALISVEEMTEDILLKRGMTQHFWWRILPLVCEAVQELGLTSMPIVRHTQITKLPHETWFKIPNGFIDWVSVGIRNGNKWIPVAISNRLIPYPNSECAGGQFDNEYDPSKFKTKGEWKSWLNSSCKWNNGDFFGDDFFNEDFSDEPSTTDQPQPFDPYAFYGYGAWGYGYLFPYSTPAPYLTNDIGAPVQGRFSQFIRPDEVTFNVEKGIIMCPDAFPSNILYLSYVGLGSADTLTFIPVKAQAVIEAYVEWKYSQNTKNQANQAQMRWLKTMYDEQHRIYRARNNDLTETTIRRTVDRGYIQNAWWIGNASNFTTPSQPSTPIIYYTNQALTVYTGGGGVTYAQNTALIGKNIIYLILNDNVKTTGYYLDGDKLIFTDRTEFYEPTKIIVYYNN